MNRNEKRELFLKTLAALGKSEVSKADIKSVATQVGIGSTSWFTKAGTRVGHGKYRVPESMPTAATAAKVRKPRASKVPKPVAQTVEMSAQVVPINREVERSGHHIQNVTTDLDNTNLVPKVYKNYVPFGNFTDVLSIVESNRFFPVFVSGHSGNGKTMSIEQACAYAGRKFICVSMTPETDESDLLGNFVLVDGNMEWRDGPVTTAARVGAVLCIDEIDYGAQNLSCLQRVLEGKPFMLKKKGEIITPAPGFTVFATANTKGKGSDDGRYMFTNVLNEAFLERFRTTMEQEWPPVAVEKKIIRKEMDAVGRSNNEFADKLVEWADVVRKAFVEGATDEVISTRRLVHIVETYGIFGDKMKAVGLCLNRFDEDTKASFLDLYTKVDADAAQNTAPTSAQSNPGEEVQF
jgi:midasin (ATPase involved in ribosome maturation)